MNTIRVLQLGEVDLRESLAVSDRAEWYYEPDWEELPKGDLDLVLLDREITEEEYEILMERVRAYCLFGTEALELAPDSNVRRLFACKAGRKLPEDDLNRLLTEDLSDYFSGSYGEKFSPMNLSIAQGFQGKVAWRGFQGVELEGNYGEGFRQVVFWRYNIPIPEGQSLEFWLEYEKDASVEISMNITQFPYGSVSEIRDMHSFSEKELDKIIVLEGRPQRASLFLSLNARGHGRLKIIALHDRFSRRGRGNFMPGGERRVTSDREEVFYYFDPGNLKPPLNVYFSGYKTQEGFEGYYMMRRLKHPFLLISESRLEGGGFYMGSEEYEDMIEGIIQEHMEKLHFWSEQVILSGLSMGTFGAMYYGCRIWPHTVLIGKPLASIGDVAANERINRPRGFPTSLDVLYKLCGDLSQEAVERLNDKFWSAFDRANWSRTQFAVAYMIEDDYDGTAYEKLQSHLKDAGARIYGKGLHGRHNDDTSGIVNWFVSQYHKILEKDFAEEED